MHDGCADLGGVALRSRRRRAAARPRGPTARPAWRCRLSRVRSPRWCLPRTSVWSYPTDVIAATTGSMTFVPSSRPPSPTSIEADVHPLPREVQKRKCQQRLVIRRPPVTRRRALDSRHHRIEQCGEAFGRPAAPSTRARSVIERRCGFVCNRCDSPRPAAPQRSSCTSNLYRWFRRCGSSDRRRCGSPSSRSNVRIRSSL